MSDFKECLNLVLSEEKGFQNDPRDSGNQLSDGRSGSTNLGVTQKTWEEWVGHPVSEADMRALTPEKVAPMYEQKYWRPCYGEVLPRGLNLVTFSAGIMSGTGKSVKLLQQSIGCLPDGIIGPRTREQIRNSNIATLITQFSEARRQYYRSLKTFPIYGKGWLARVDREESKALDMAKNA